MANSFQNTELVLNQFMAQFRNNLQFAKTAGRDFTKEYENMVMRLGDTIDYRLSYNWDVGENIVVSAQDVVDKIRQLSVNQIRNIAIEFNGLELTLEAAMKEPYQRKYMLTQVNKLANSVEKYIGANFKDQVYYTVGTPGSELERAVSSDAFSKMAKLGIPVSGEIYGALNADAANSLKKSVSNFFNKDLNTAAIKKGYIGEMDGFNMFQTNFLPKHIAGIGAAGSVTSGKKSGGLVNGQVTSGSTIAVDGLGATASGNFFNKGDIIEIDGCFAYNTLGDVQTDDLMTFTVTADVPADGSGACNIPVSPTIVTTGRDQNCTVIPDNAQVNLYDSHNVSIFYFRDALVFAAPKLQLPRSAVTKEYVYDKDYRMALSYLGGASVEKASELRRLDILFGVAFNPEYAVRVVS